MCIFVKGYLTFELEYILFRDQTFSVTLLDTMIRLVVNEVLLFNIFTRALYKSMQHAMFTSIVQKYATCHVFFFNTSLIHARNSGHHTWVRQQQPQEQCYPLIPACAVFLCVQRMV